MIKTLLDTSLDDIPSIVTPTIGAGGIHQGTAFSAGHATNGVYPLRRDSHVSFPLSVVDLNNGKIDFWFKPVATVVANDKFKHILVGLGDPEIYPRMLCTVGGGLVSFRVEAASGSTYETTAPSSILTTNVWAKVTLAWNRYDATDSLKILVGDVRKDTGHANGGWNLSALNQAARLFIGSFGPAFPWYADGVIDQFTITTDDSITAPPIVVPPPPSPPPPVVPPVVVPPGTEWEPLTSVGVHLLKSQAGVPVARAQLAEPAVGTSVIDPAFGGLSLKRLTTRGGPVYSQLQAWSQDEKYMILVDGGVGYRVVDAVTGIEVAAIKNNPIWSANAYAPRWYNNKVYFFGSPSPCKLYSIDMAGVTQLIWTGPATHPFFKADRTEEQISENGITLAWCHGAPTGARLFAINLNSGATMASIDLGQLPSVNDPQWGLIEPNWTAASPLGNYIVLGWGRDGGSRSCGLELFDINTGVFVRNVFQGRAHGDMCLLPDGREAYFSVQTSTSDPTLFYFDGSGAVLVRTMPWGTFGHASCRGPKNWAVISGFDIGGSYIGQNEVYLMRLTGAKAGEIVRLCHHRSKDDPAVQLPYWTQPKATMSASGRFISFNDNWGAMTGAVSGATECYIAQVGA